jgi:hypothetical protein
MACCVIVAEMLSRLFRMVRRDAASRTDPELLRSVTAVPPRRREG